MKESNNKSEIMNVDEMPEVSEAETEVSLLRDNRGVGVVEIILILVVLIALVLVFKEQLSGMVTKAMDTLEKSVEKVLS